jgi:hypothetical protein
MLVGRPLPACCAPNDGGATPAGNGTFAFAALAAFMAGGFAFDIVNCGEFLVPKVGAFVSAG